MSSYRNFIIISLTLIFSFGCASNQNNISSKDDLSILLALDSESKRNYKNSQKYYDKLYYSTKEERYLKKALVYSYKSKNYKDMQRLSKEGLENYKETNEYYTQNLVVALLSQNSINEALVLAKELVSISPKAVNYEIVANIYYAKKDYKNALKYYESTYAQKPNRKTLIKLTNILYNYLNKKDTAIAYLETYVQTYGCAKIICDKLMIIYQEQGNIDGMLSILNRMYEKFKINPSLKKTTTLVQNLIVTLLEQKDINKAIKFLEDTAINDTKLLNLYYRNGQTKKALTKTIKLYRKTNNPTLLGKIAMYRFETTKNKKKVMINVIANFELAFKKGVIDAGYYNYYGYLLIDYDINPKKGLLYVKKALNIIPKNIAFLDSLAWGYYKTKQCKKASIVMNQIVKQIGKKDKEIMKHFNKIRSCK